MKKLLILLFVLLISSYSFSWVKVFEKDEFGDKTNKFHYVQKFKEGNIIIYRDKDTKSKNCVISYYGKGYFSNGNYKMKFKCNTVFGDETIKEIDVYLKEGKIYATEINAFSIINAFKDSDIVKFSFEGKGFQINQGNFNEIYDDNF